ncbi:hypothetical protein AAG570_006375 [Ranatra chinensis]|uniref:Uncharacterized protein n=1 Tax=Ranatra chinensis TaxID=642074 RepID=A0ABD0YTW3_9HEMI
MESGSEGGYRRIKSTTMKAYTAIVAVMLAVELAGAYVIPQYAAMDEETLLSPEGYGSAVVQPSLLREKRSPDGSISVTASKGPGHGGSAGVGYDHQVWKGKHGESFHLGGTYSGQFGNGKPQHSFGIGGTYKF